MVANTKAVEAALDVMTAAFPEGPFVETSGFTLPIELIVLSLAKIIATTGIPDTLKDRAVEALRVAISPPIWDEQVTPRGDW